MGPADKVVSAVDSQVMKPEVTYTNRRTGGLITPAVSVFKSPWTRYLHSHKPSGVMFELLLSDEQSLPPV